MVQLLQPQDLGQLLISASPQQVQHWVISCSLTGDLDACIQLLYVTLLSWCLLQQLCNMLLTVCVVSACKQVSAGTLLQHLLSHHQFMAPTERCAMVCCAYKALCIVWFTIIVVHQHSHTDGLIVTADAVGNHCCKRQLASIAVCSRKMAFHDSLAAYNMSEAQEYPC